MALITSVTRFGKILKSLTANRFERLLGNCPHFQPTLAILSSYWGIILNIVQTVSATLPLTFLFSIFSIIFVHQRPGFESPSLTTHVRKIVHS